MSKPIEVGCRVMCVQVRAPGRESLLGKCGTVVDKINPGDAVIVQGVNYRSDPTTSWVVELDHPVSVVFESLGRLTITSAAFRNASLIRIDGDVEEESEADEISKVKETV